MLTKFASGMAAAALVAGFAMSTAPAKAGSTEIFLGFGIPGPAYTYDYYDGPYYGRPYPVYGEPRRWRGRISCGDGLNSAREEGFRRVRPIDCSGRSYSYRGYRDGTVWRIRVSASTGDVIGARPARY